MDCNETGILCFLNTKGEIPAEAEMSHHKSSNKKGASAEKVGEVEGLDSEDEEVDQEELKRGDLEG